MASGDANQQAAIQAATNAGQMSSAAQSAARDNAIMMSGDTNQQGAIQGATTAAKNQQDLINNQNVGGVFGAEGVPNQIGRDYLSILQGQMSGKALDPTRQAERERLAAESAGSRSTLAGQTAQLGLTNQGFGSQLAHGTEQEIGQRNLKSTLELAKLEQDMKSGAADKALGYATTQATTGKEFANANEADLAGWGQSHPGTDWKTDPLTRQKLEAVYPGGKAAADADPAAFESWANNTWKDASTVKNPFDELYNTFKTSKQVTQMPDGSARPATRADAPAGFTGMTQDEIVAAADITGMGFQMHKNADGSTYWTNPSDDVVAGVKQSAPGVAGTVAETETAATTFMTDVLDPANVTTDLARVTQYLNSDAGKTPSATGFTEWDSTTGNTTRVRDFLNGTGNVAIGDMNSSDWGMMFSADRPAADVDKAITNVTKSILANPNAATNIFSSNDIPAETKTKIAGAILARAKTDAVQGLALINADTTGTLYRAAKAEAPVAGTGTTKVKQKGFANDYNRLDSFTGKGTFFIDKHGNLAQWSADRENINLIGIDGSGYKYKVVGDTTGTKYLAIVGENVGGDIFSPANALSSGVSAIYNWAKTNDAKAPEGKIATIFD
jgi:hypothetical protein